MHYFKFEISDWVLSTAHLTPEEEGVYLRLVNHYYDTERPIPLATQSVIRRLRLGSVADIVSQILDEYFVKNEKGYSHKCCDKNLKEYKKIVNKNRKNGANGGRPKRRKASSITQSVTSGNPEATQTKPKGNPIYYPLLNNLLLITYNKTLGDQLGEIREITNQRKKHIQARINEDSKRNEISWWDDYFNYVLECPHLLGMSPAKNDGDKPWKASFDWLINPNNLVKVVEGKYDA